MPCPLWFAPVTSKTYRQSWNTTQCSPRLHEHTQACRWRPLRTMPYHCTKTENVDRFIRARRPSAYICMCWLLASQEASLAGHRCLPCLGRAAGLTCCSHLVTVPRGGHTLAEWQASVPYLGRVAGHAVRVKRAAVHRFFTRGLSPTADSDSREQRAFEAGSAAP